MTDANQPPDPSPYTVQLERALELVAQLRIGPMFRNEQHEMADELAELLKEIVAAAEDDYAMLHTEPFPDNILSKFPHATFDEIHVGTDTDRPVEPAQSWRDGYTAGYIDADNGLPERITTLPDDQLITVEVPAPTKHAIDQMTNYRNEVESAVRGVCRCGRVFHGATSDEVQLLFEEHRNEVEREELTGGAALAERVRKLEAWKAEATTVLQGWDAVTALVPPEYAERRLGRPWSQITAEYLSALHRIEQQARSLFSHTDPYPADQPRDQYDPGGMWEMTMRMLDTVVESLGSMTTGGPVPLALADQFGRELQMVKHYVRQHGRSVMYEAMTTPMKQIILPDKRSEEG